MKLIGIAAILTAALLASNSVSADRQLKYHDDITSLCDSVLWISNGNVSADIENIELRGSLPKYRDGQGLSEDNSIGLVWSFDSIRNVYYSAGLTPGNNDANHIADLRYMEFSVKRHTGEHEEIIFAKKLTENIGLGTSENSLCVEINHKNDIINIYGGNHELRPLHSIPLENKRGITSMGIYADGYADIILAVSDFITDKSTGRRSVYDTARLIEELSGATDGAEGLWRYIDRENDERYCRPGGEYSLAVKADQKGGFEIIYLDGARINADLWKPGLIKGYLTPTIFNGNYNLTWYDASFSEVDTECYAQIDESGMLLTVSFPLLKSQLRFRRQR